MKRTLVFLPPLLAFVLVAAIAFAQPSTSHPATSVHAASPGNHLLNVTSCPTEKTLIADIGTVGPGGTVQFSISSPCTISFSNTLLISQNLRLDNDGRRVTLDGGG